MASTDTDRPVSADDEIRILLVGSPGAGKSATGNTIANADVFPEYAIVDSHNTHTKAHSTNVFGKKICIVDTPGCLFTDDPSKISDDRWKECIENATPGPHAMVLVISAANRFTPQEIQTLSYLMQVIHKEFEKFGIVVFTWTETWKRQKYTVETFFKTIPESAQDVLSSCINKKRALAFQNSNKDESQVEQLLDMVEEIKRANNHQFFRVDDLRLAGDVNRAHDAAPAAARQRSRQNEAQEVFRRKLDEIKGLDKNLHPDLIRIFQETLTELQMKTGQESKKHRNKIHSTKTEGKRDQCERSVWVGDPAIQASGRSNFGF